jgi:hypothetical protein
MMCPGIAQAGAPSRDILRTGESPLSAVPGRLAAAEQCGASGITQSKAIAAYSSNEEKLARS